MTAEEALQEHVATRDLDSVLRGLGYKDHPWRHLDRHAASASEAAQRLPKLAA